MREYGAVSYWNFDKGFGFARSDIDGKDTFIHVVGSGLESQGLDELKKGTKISYEIGVNSKSNRPLATNIKVLS